MHPTQYALGRKAPPLVTPPPIEAPSNGTSLKFPARLRTPAVAGLALVLTVLVTLGSVAPTATGAATSVPATSTGRVLYVAPWGQDYVDGNKIPANSAERPWRTLLQTFNRVRPGDTVIIRGGTYRERVVAFTSAGTQAAPIRVRNYPGERVVLSGVLQFNKMSWWIVSGLNVTYNPAIGRTQFLVKFDGGIGWQFLNAEVSGTRGVSNVMVSGLAGAPSRYRIAGTCIHGNKASGDAYMNDHNIYLMPGLDAGAGVIERNLLFDAPNGSNIKVGANAYDNGAANLTIRYNTMAGAAAGVIIGYGARKNIVWRNLFATQVGGNYSYNAAVMGNHVSGSGNAAVHTAFGSFQAPVRSTQDSRRPIRSLLSTRVDPRFDKVNACAGFRPRNPVAAQYGRYVGLG